MNVTGRVFDSTSHLPQSLKGGVVAIGNFDGVHRGHQAVLDEASAIAGGLGVKVNVLTFEPHPRSLFRPQEPVCRLTPAPMKARILGMLGVEAVYEQRFDKEFAARSASDFISEVLVGQLGAAHIVTGYDFRFGKGREGDTDMLVHAGRESGFGVTLAPAFRDEGGEVISSTRIRSALAAGDTAGAAGLLGYRHAVEGEIIHGKKLGRTLGFPTANMALPPATNLKPGIYAVRLRRADGTLHDGVASFGRRPTVDEPDAPLLLETFVFDASPDLYGETCTVSLFGYLRPEIRFDGLDPLVDQMKRDEAEARALLAGVTPLSALDRELNF